MSVATLWRLQVCALGTILRARETERWTMAPKNAQFVSSIFIQCRCCRQVLVFHQSQANHGTVFQASVVTPGRKKKKERRSRGMREGRVEDVVERMTKKGKMRQERLRVLRQTDSETGGFLVSERQGGKGKRRETQTSWQITFPSNRVRSSSLMRQHQGNGWCGADMLLWLAMLV